MKSKNVEKNLEVKATSGASGENLEEKCVEEYNEGFCLTFIWF